MSLAPGWRGTDVIFREHQKQFGKTKTFQRIGSCNNVMETKEQLQKQISELDEQKKPLQEKLNEIRKKEKVDVEEKIKRCLSMKDKFTLEELRFAATAKCSCGAGLAYPKNIGVHGSWYCSDILLGRAIPLNQPDHKKHDDGFPFMFYEIKSEDQPSAYGATTRPKELQDVQVSDTTEDSQRNKSL